MDLKQGSGARLAQSRWSPAWHCAYGVSDNHTVDTDPEAWKIIDEKLYLNYDKSVYKLFLREPA